MAYDIFMKKGLQAAYDKIATEDINTNTLYFCTDSGNLYLGQTAIGGKVEFTKPETGVKGTLYITGGVGYAWDGTTYVQISKPALTVIPESGADDNGFPTTKAVVDFITKKIEAVTGGDISQIKNDVSTLKSDVEAVENDIMDLNAKDSELDSKIIANTGEITNLKNNKADRATTLSGYGIDDAYTKTDADAMVDNKINTALGSVLSYKGTVESYDALPINSKIGDVYNVKNADSEHGVKAGDNVAWDGTAWDVLAGTVDMSAYSTTDQMNEAINDAKTEAKQYTDNAVSETLQQATTHADSVGQNMLTSANEYTESAKGVAITEAQSYTDNALTWGSF